MPDEDKLFIEIVAANVIYYFGVEMFFIWKNLVF
jgi:hypothetical protein